MPGTAPPATIGPYSVVRELGRGGMGVVYLANDPKLDRQVAIKALPAHLAQDHDRLTRFQREAKVLASLNHPGIAAIYGLEEAATPGGTGTNQYLVLEYVEGESLADRLARGPVPIDEALPLAKQLAEALEAAHEKGIVHRDLKPANLMLTPEGRLKVLDFGLARADTVGAASSTGGGGAGGFAAGDSPTLTSPVVHSPTIPGAIMGTAGYMSPEQARGKPVDKRSDVFSFGCVLFEMLSGTMPFGGETVADSLGATLHKEIDFGKLPPGTPARIRELLTTCLAKDRKQRLHDIGDARLAIERTGSTEERALASRHSPHRSAREVAAWAAAALVFIGAAVAWHLRPASSGQQGVVRFTIHAPPGTNLDPESVNTVVAPDGRKVAFIASEIGRPGRLWVRDMRTLTSRAIEGTEGAHMPFWSPDGNSVAFFANAALCRVPAEGGPVQRLADAPGPRGGDWGEAGVILFAPTTGGVLRVVPEAGGPATEATTLDLNLSESGHRFPQFLPGGRTFIYASITQTEAAAREEYTRWGSLDSKATKAVVTADSRATFAAPHWLLFNRSQMICAQRFDPGSGTATGEVLPTGVQFGGQIGYGGRFDVSASRTGVLACTVDGDLKTNIVEISPDGQIARTLPASPESQTQLRVSPDGTKLVSVVRRSTSVDELRVVDLSRESATSRAVDDSKVNDACWSPDGQWLYYSSTRKSRDLFRCRVAGTAQPELIHETGNLWAGMKDVSADGRAVVFSMLHPKAGRDLWMLDTTTNAARAVCDGPADEYDARLSPDGCLIALASIESGRPELYVQAFPEAQTRIRVSVAGIARDPSGSATYSTFRWSNDGSILWFLDTDGRTIRSSRIAAKPTLTASKPEPAMRLPAGLLWPEIAPDGKSVFACVPAEGQASCSIAITMNWTEGLIGRASAGATP